MTPRVLLLQEDQTTGGVTTIAQTLCDGLQRRSWPITALALNRFGWLRRFAATQRCDVILASHNFRPAYVAWVLGLLMRKPVVVWVHGPLHEVLAQARASTLKRAWLRWLYRRLPRFVFVSQVSRDSFERFMGSSLAPHRRSVVIPNAVTLTGREPVAHSSDCAANPQLAYIGRLSPEKRPDLLLETLRLLPPRYHLTLVGDGPLRDTLQQSGADLLACGRLTLAGAQPHGPGLYAPWRLTLLASRYEGCPMTLLESFASGVPCVTLPIPAAQELMGEDAPYLLARDDSPKALADAVQAACTVPRHQLRADMARVLARHEEKDFVRRWQHVLEEAARPC